MFKIVYIFTPYIINRIEKREKMKLWIDIIPAALENSVC